MIFLHTSSTQLSAQEAITTTVELPAIPLILVVRM